MAMAVGVCIALSACDGDSKSEPWQPGPEVDPASPQVYFTADNEYAFDFTEEDVKSIPVSLGRLNTQGACRVPLTLTAGDAHITLADTAVFADGQDQCTIHIDCEGIPLRQRFDIAVAIPADYATPYAQGSDTYTATVAVVAWETIDDNVEYFFEQDGSYVYGEPHGALMYLDGSDKLKFTNYLGSGLDLIFTLDASSTGCSVDALDIVPLYNNYNEEGSEWNCWYLCDEATATYPSWTTDDGATLFTLWYVYRAGYSYFSIDEGFAAWWGYMTLGDGSAPWLRAWATFQIPAELRDKIQYRH